MSLSGPKWIYMEDLTSPFLLNYFLSYWTTLVNCFFYDACSCTKTHLNYTLVMWGWDKGWQVGSTVTASERVDVSAPETNVWNAGAVLLNAPKQSWLTREFDRDGTWFLFEGEEDCLQVHDNHYLIFVLMCVWMSELFANCLRRSCSIFLISYQLGMNSDIWTGG